MIKKLIFYTKIINIILMFVILSVFTACDSDSDSNSDLKDQYPSLIVVNQYENRSIRTVELVGYEFNHLQITTGNSQLFSLDNGMPGGYENINITVTYGSGTANWSVSNTFDFNDGETTTITLRGSNKEGDPYFNNPCIE